MNPVSASVSDISAAAAFEQHRKRLWGIAYRMLGSRAEAEDMVQDAWLRWHRSDRDQIRVGEAWLVTTITRLCIDRLRQLRAERAAYTGPWLPEPLLLDLQAPADHAAELASDLSVAFLALLERLAPEERAALLLRDVFDSDYSDIAQILGKSQATCRQTVSRARRRIRDRRPRVQVSAAAHAALLTQLVQAIQTQDKAALVNLLAKDATWTADGGGQVRAAKKPVHGGERVARFAVGVFQRYVRDIEFRPTMVNRQPGLAVFYAGTLFSLITILTDGQHILEVHNVMNPDKLRSFHPSERP